jgi:dienelactone hydrolase
MITLIVSDIFGLTPALRELAQNVCEQAIILDPYQGKEMSFSNESSAYSYFTTQIGLDNYHNHIATCIAKQKSKIRLIGFSIGASAIWQISENPNSNIVSAMLFYGSQIRFSANLNPAFEVTVFLPKYEPHFCVERLIKQLKGRDNTFVEQTNYLHGFMNRHSDNFNLTAYKCFIEKLKIK